MLDYVLKLEYQAAKSIKELLPDFMSVGGLRLLKHWTSQYLNCVSRSPGHSLFEKYRVL